MWSFSYHYEILITIVYILGSNGMIFLNINSLQALTVLIFLIIILMDSHSNNRNKLEVKHIFYYVF